MELDHSIQLFEVLVLLGLAAAGLALFERLKLPAIAGFLVIGAIAGPGVLGLVPEPERVRALAEIGVVFLLFEIGLDLPLDRIRRLWRGALLGGCLQVGLTMAVVYGFAVVFGMGSGSALILGGLVTMSSTALVLRLLSPLLADPSANSASDILWAMARVVGGLGVVLFVVRFAVPFALDRMARLRSPDLFSILALLIVLGSAFLAEELGLTLAVGAFLAGVAASSSPYAQHLFSEVIPLRGVVLGIFFTAVGMLFEPMVMIEHAPMVLAILLAITLVKGSIIFGISTLVLGRGVQVGVLSGIALAQCGEFSFVLAAVGGRAGLLDQSLHQAVLAASIISLLATPFLFRAAPAIANRVEARLGRWLQFREREARDPMNADRASDGERVIVIGYGPAGRTIAKLLKSQSLPYVVVDANATTVAEGVARGERIVFGDAARPSFLERLDVARAKLITVAISDPLATSHGSAASRGICRSSPGRASWTTSMSSSPLAQPPSWRKSTRAASSWCGRPFHTSTFIPARFATSPTPCAPRTTV
ncbi:MAG: cation:proton antiporter [Deltaproteobacteria bacterium]|nr:cation:proton antiporter [Deltaproteobacteria bacterium]